MNNNEQVNFDMTYLNFDKFIHLFTKHKSNNERINIFIFFFDKSVLFFKSESK